MAFDKRKTKPIVKVGIVLIAVMLVIGVGGASILPLLQSIAGTSDSGPAATQVATNTIPAIDSRYQSQVQVLDKMLKADPKKYDVILAEARAYQDWAGERFQLRLKTANQSASMTIEPQWQLSVDSYKKALAIKPGDPNVTTDMAIAQFYGGDAKAAVVTAESVIKAQPEFAPAHFNLGVFLEMSDPARSIKEYERYIALEPKGQYVAPARERIAAQKQKSQPVPTTGNSSPIQDGSGLGAPAGSQLNK